MAVYKCAGRKRLNEKTGEPFCEYEAPHPWPGACPSCGCWFDCEGFGMASGPREPARTMLSAASAVGAKIDYEPTGVECLDKALNGGLVRGRVVLVGGPQGSGKTSLLATACERLSKRLDAVTLYASAEEFSDALLPMFNRLGITDERVKLMDRTEATNIHDVFARCSELKARVAVFDSLQKMSANNAEAGENAKALKDYVQRHKICAILVNHMSKDLDFKGGTDVTHEVDAMVAVYKFNQDEDGRASKLFGTRKLREMGIGIGGATYAKDLGDHIRVVMVGGKSRQGFSGNKAYFHMTTDGHIEALEPKTNVIAFPSGGDDEDDED